MVEALWWVLAISGIVGGICFIAYHAQGADIFGFGGWLIGMAFMSGFSFCLSGIFLLSHYEAEDKKNWINDCLSNMVDESPQQAKYMCEIYFEQEH